MIGPEVSEVDFNGIVEFSCKPGMFAFTGDYERRCQQNGNLTGHPLRCFATGMLFIFPAYKPNVTVWPNMCVL